MSERRPSKGEINRAGRHLAARLQAVRAGSRQLLVDLDDETDLRARELVEWWRDEHLEPMDETRRIVARMCPPNLPPGESVVSVASRAKRFTTIVDKLLREPVKLADMADVGGVRAVVDSRAEVDTLVEQLKPDRAGPRSCTSCGSSPTRSLPPSSVRRRKAYRRDWPPRSEWRTPSYAALDFEASAHEHRDQTIPRRL